MSAVLSFDPAAHLYTLPDGTRVPSVTEILKATGVSVDFEQLGAMSQAIGHAISLKRDIGKAVHVACHYYDDNDLAVETVDPEVLPYLTAWMTFRENAKLQPLSRERMVYHPTLNYCGTLDGVFLTPDGLRRILVDTKIGDPTAAAVSYQLAGYQLAWDVDHPDEPIDERWCVQLTPDSRVPYRVTPFNDWRDREVWKAIVTTFHVQADRRRAA